MMDRRRLLLLGPLGIVAAAGAGSWAVLDRMGQGTFDPHRVDSPLLNRPIPDFQLPGQPPSQGFGAADIRAWASRCWSTSSPAGACPASPSTPT